jgi:hypothetical protein
MAQSPVSAGSPVPHLFEQLSYLPPLVRMLAGGAMLAMGITGICFGLTLYSVVLLGLGLFLGLPLLSQGWTDRRRSLVEERELARARAELPDLRSLVDAEMRGRRNVNRLLRERGYSTARAQRWIAVECGVAARDH